MINGYRGGKFTASLSGSNNKSDQSSNCSKGKNCCQKTGKKDASCSNNDTKKSSSIFKRKNKNENALSGMIQGIMVVQSLVVQVKNNYQINSLS